MRRSLEKTSLIEILKIKWIKFKNVKNFQEYFFDGFSIALTHHFIISSFNNFGMAKPLNIFLELWVIRVFI
ncbi:unnamed protein product [Blepharisma stoltei]|uniref:Uncharacterized protein n=1 Tax=Blepharisma stoltei TaxID=1481888 RepID=A0AAU9JYF0_9CILI|nr:unnamed protein product [Blepharisma stoltei]